MAVDTAKFLLLGVPVADNSAPPGSDWRALDKFTTAASPVNFPRTCEPGPGKLRNAGSGSSATISAGKMTVSNDDGTELAMRFITGIDRVLGTGYYANVTAVTGTASGLNSLAGAEEITINITGTLGSFHLDIEEHNSQNGLIVSDFEVSTGEFCILLVSGGGFAILTKVSSDWRAIVFSTAGENRGASASCYTGNSIEFETLGITKKGLALAPFGASNPAHGDTITTNAPAEFCCDITFTADAEAWVGDFAEARFRVTDANNYWCVRAEVGATNGVFSLIEVVSGTPTEIDSVTDVPFTANSVSAVQLHQIGGTVNAWARDVTGGSGPSRMTCSLSTATGKSINVQHSADDGGIRHVQVTSIRGCDSVLTDDSPLTVP